jgi:hypothetical protein
MPKGTPRYAAARSNVSLAYGEAGRAAGDVSGPTQRREQVGLGWDTNAKGMGVERSQ